MARPHPRDRVLTAGLWVPSKPRNCTKVTRTNAVHDRPRPIGRETESGMEAVP